MNDRKIDSKTLEFLSTWRDRMKSQQKKTFWLFLSVFVVTFIICILFFIWFRDNNYDRIVAQNMKYIEDSTIQEANQIEQELRNAQIVARNLASQYADLMKMEKDISIKEKLRRISDKSLFDRIAYIAPDGTDTSLEGVADVSDREYFQKGMKGEFGWEPLDKSRVTGRPTLVFYAPITVDKEIVGVLVGFYEQERMKDLFIYDLFNFAPKTFLMDGKGTVIASSTDEMINENLLEHLAKKEFVGDVTYPEIEEAIADAERTTITFSMDERNQTYVGVIVQFNVNDWMIMSELPYDVTANMVRNANRIGSVFITLIVVTFILAVAIIMFFFRKLNSRFEGEMAVAVESVEQAIEYEEYQYGIIQSLANTYSSVYVVNEDGRYRRVKEDEHSVLSIPEEGVWREGLDAYCDRFVSEEFKEEVRTFMWEGIRGWQPEKADAWAREFQRMDSHWRKAKILPMQEDEGETTAFIYAVQGFDREKEKELKARRALEDAYDAAQMASEAKTLFLSNMSHDIRTPMNAIIGMTAIAAANLDNPEKISDCLKKITISSKHLLGLINEVLDMSKIESGKIDLAEEDFSLSELIDTLVSLNMPLINEKSHSLVVTVKSVTHENVVGDSTRLQQVLTNLLTNAIKYTPEGGKIEIEVTEKEINKSTVGCYEITVKDNGIGMTEEFRQQIFEPFVRASDNRIMGIQGTGLGMPIAKNIIRMMNGDITVESELDKGSKFTVSFVLKLQQEDKDVNYDSFINLPVLVVDDDEDACESTCMMLNSLKMDSEWVTSGKEAMVKLIEHHDANDDYYAVILDWKMPDMDGVEVAREIRKKIGDEIPIVIISAYDWVDIEKEAREAGVNAFLSKPLFQSKVIDLFSSLVGNKVNVETKEAETDFENYDFSGKRILLVEDNEINREIVVELLAMLGLEIETAENGKIGVDMFAESAPGYYDLVFMDIQMPVMNGYEATRQIRALPHPNAATMPIIAMTANAFSSDVRAAEDAGMNGHIAKPIEMKRVLKILKEQLEK